MELLYLFFYSSGTALFPHILFLTAFPFKRQDRMPKIEKEKKREKEQKRDNYDTEIIKSRTIRLPSGLITKGD